MTCCRPLRAEIPFDPAAEWSRGHSAAVARQFPSAADEDHGRYRLNVIARCKATLSVSIDLAKAQAGLEFLRRGLKHRRHRAARAAPRCPKVHQQRQIGSASVAVKMGSVEINRLPRKKLLMAVAAFGALIAPLSRQAVERMTVRTRNGQRCCHCRSHFLHCQTDGLAHVSVNGAAEPTAATLQIGTRRSAARVWRPDGKMPPMPRRARLRTATRSACAYPRRPYRVWIAWAAPPPSRP